jgi:hypothetical protein
MINLPKTIDQAKKYRYGKWSGNPTGNKYNDKYCAYEVMDKSSHLFHQCRFKNGKGIYGLYCGTHEKWVV